MAFTADFSKASFVACKGRAFTVVFPAIVAVWCLAADAAYGFSFDFFAADGAFDTFQ